MLKNIYQNKETGLPMGVIPNKYREYWNPPLTPKPIFLILTEVAY
nr:hypothetical protein [Helicobacter pylori]